MKTTILVLLVGMVLFGDRRASGQPMPQVTWGDAPSIAQKMTLGPTEFASLFRESERRDVAYSGPWTSHCTKYKNPDGQPRLQGFWNRTTEGKTDTEYRTFSTVQTSMNPANLLVCTVLRFAPPQKEPPATYGGSDGVTAPARRVDLVIQGRINHMGGTVEFVQRRVSTWKQEEARGFQRDKETEARSDNRYDYIPDLGWGLDHQSVYVYGDTRGARQIVVKLARIRDNLWIQLDLMVNDGTVGKARALALAKGAAALLARKVFGVDVPPQEGEEDEGEVGIIDAYVTLKPADTPQQDRREDSIPLGGQFYVALVFRPTRPDANWDLEMWINPSPQSIELSRKRMAGGTGANAPLRPDPDLRAHLVNGDGGWSSDFARPWIRKRWNEHYMVIYQLYDTTQRTRTSFWKGPGLWEVRARMTERGSGGTLEVSTTRTSLTVFEPEQPQARPKESGRTPSIFRF